MAEDAGHRGRRENAEERKEADLARWQEQVERERGEADVAKAEDRLPDQDGKRGRTQREAPEAEAAAPRAGKDKRRHGHEDQRKRGPPRRFARQGRKLGQRVGKKRNCRKPDQRGGNAVGHRCEGRDSGDVISVQPEARIDAIAHRPARHGAEADGVAEGIGHQPARHGDRQRQRLADIAQPRPVVAHKEQISDQCRQCRQQQRAGGRRLDMRKHVGKFHVPQQLRDGDQTEAEERDGKDIGEGRPHERPEAGCLCFFGHDSLQQPRTASPRHCHRNGWPRQSRAAPFSRDRAAGTAGSCRSAVLGRASAKTTRRGYL